MAKNQGNGLVDQSLHSKNSKNHKVGNSRKGAGRPKKDNIPANTSSILSFINNTSIESNNDSN